MPAASKAAGTCRRRNRSRNKQKLGNALVAVKRRSSRGYRRCLIGLVPSPVAGSCGNGIAAVRGDDARRTRSRRVAARVAQKGQSVGCEVNFGLSATSNQSTNQMQPSRAGPAGIFMQCWRTHSFLSEWPPVHTERKPPY